MPLGVKTLIIDVLQRTVGEFIVGLDQDNLKVGVTSGEIVLTDLELNTAALARFHLPVDVRSARVASLRVEIPWVALSSKPVRIEIVGVGAVASPAPPVAREAARDAGGGARHRARALAARRAELAALDAQFTASLDAAEADDDGYLKKLAEKIITNIEITVRDVHLRMEARMEARPGDTAADPTLELGVVLDSFTLDDSAGTDETSEAQRTAARADKVRSECARRGAARHDPAAYSSCPPRGVRRVASSASRAP